MAGGVIFDDGNITAAVIGSFSSRKIDLKSSRRNRVSIGYVVETDPS